MNRKVLSASDVYVSEYWDKLTDAELMLIPWYIEDPRKLENIKYEKPDSIGNFQVELEYELDKSSQPVRCVHCPNHQQHWHGYVLKDEDGNRYLLGSQCGPKAYGADYRVAHRARSRAKRRYDALVRWHRTYGKLPDFIDALVEVESDTAFRAVRRARGAFENQAPGLVKQVRQLRPTGPLEQIILSTVTGYRDTAAEAKRKEQYQREMVALADLPNREHRRQLQALQDRLRPNEPIIVSDNRQIGPLNGSRWLLAPTNPTTQVQDVIARLRAYAALGAKTEGKTVQHLNRLAHDVDLDLRIAEAALLVIRNAGDFFEPRNLENLALWAHHTLSGVGEIVADGSKIRISDRFGPTIILDLGANWRPPGELFLELLG